MSLLTKKEIYEVVYQAIDEHNNCLENDQEKLVKQKNQLLLGKGGAIDSLGFMCFIVSIEEKIKDLINIEIVILNEEELFKDDGAFYSIESLCDWIEKQL